MKRILGAFMAILCLVIMTTPSEARKYKAKVQPPQEFCLFGLCQVHAQEQPLRGARSNNGPKASSSGVTYLSHPNGCPRRLFCGCGAAVKLFGKPIRDLWLVAEWRRRFPQASASQGMAALRGRRGGGHIVVLDRHVSGSTWMVYDYNSGGRRSRYHARNIAGYYIVNPHAGRYASM